jgi:hypothetical protein
VVSGGDQEHGGGVAADSVEAEQVGSGGGDERDDEVVQPFDLAVEEIDAPAELAQRDADRVPGGVARPWPQCGESLGQRKRAAENRKEAMRCLERCLRFPPFRGHQRFGVRR